MKSPYRYFTFTLAAGAVQQLGIFGKFVRVLSNSIVTNPQISIQNEALEVIPSGVAIEIPEGDFSYVSFYNPALVPMTLEVCFSSGIIHDSRLSLSGTVNTSDANLLNKLSGDQTPENWGLLAISSGAGGTQVLAANANRKSVLITNPSSNTGVMYIGFDNTVALTKYVGDALSPGDSFAINDYLGTVFALASVNLEKVSFSEV